MKKLLFTFIAVMCCMVMNAQDNTFTAGGIKYNVTGENTVEVVAIENMILESIEVPATVTNPDDSKTYNVTGIGNDAFVQALMATSITIPEGVTYIGTDAFRDCKIIDFVIPSTVKSIGSNAFKSCWYLTSVTIKGGSIGENAFEGCSGLTSLSLQEGVTGIGSKAFDGCNLLNGDLVIPSTVKSIGSNAFESCYRLKSVTIKGGSIGENAFKGCTSIESISLQEGVTSIGAYAFDYATYEEDCLIIPSTVKSIGKGAFSGSSVNTVKVFALVPPELGDGAFYAHTCYVADVDKYKDCEGWEDFDLKLLTDFRLGDQMYSLNETGDLDQELTFNDKDLYVSGRDFTVTGSITYNRTFTNTNWQPLYVPFAISYSDWSDGFDVAAINNFHEYTNDMGQTTKTELEVRLVKEHTLKPNHPYLIRANKADENKPQTITIPIKKMYKSEENSIDCSSVERKYTFTGTYREFAGLKTNDYIFMSGGKLCKAPDDGVKLSAQRWYLKIESRGSQIGEGNTSEAKTMEFDIKLLDDEPTGIDEITVTRTPLRNSSEAIYNLNGMRVNGNYKGIVIKNGKKVYQR